MSYEWTDAEKRDMRHGTPLIVSGRVVFFESAEDGWCVHRNHTGSRQSCAWNGAAPVVTPWAPTLSEQERGIFESRCKELGQARAKFDDLQRMHTATAQALSHLVHKDREKDERIAKLEAELVRVLKSPVVTVASLRSMKNRVTISAAENRDGNVYGFGIIAELEHLCAEAESAAPTAQPRARAADISRLDESGEPAAGDYVASLPEVSP